MPKSTGEAEKYQAEKSPKKSGWQVPKSTREAEKYQVEKSSKNSGWQVPKLKGRPRSTGPRSPKPTPTNQCLLCIGNRHLTSDKGANPNKRRLRYLTKERSHAFSISETAVFPLTLCRIAAPRKEDYTSPPDTAQRNYRIPESQEVVRLPDGLGITV